MRKTILLIFVAMLAFTWSCQKEAGENFTQDDVLKSQPVPGNYGITFSYDGETTLTFEIDQSGAQDISHMLFRFTDCDGEYIAFDGNNMTATVNEEDWAISSTTGPGTGCNFGDDSPFIKLDGFDFKGGTVDIVIEVDGVVAVVEYLIKSGNYCFPFFEVTDLCGPDFFNPFCYEWSTETAWGDGTRYVTRGNWATYTTYTTHVDGVKIFAGQTLEAGTVHFSEVVNDEVTITITLNEGWHLAIFDKDINGYDIGEENLETVKIQGYNSKPPARNPAPGQFAHKGNLLEVIVPAATFYGIHLDVGLLTEIECPEEDEE